MVCRLCKEQVCFMSTTILSYDKVIFVHIPKCGGSSIYISLKKRGLRPKDFYAHNESRRRRISFHATMRDIANINAKAYKRNWKHFNKFALTRNPWDRLVSTFYWLQKRSVESDQEFARFKVLHNYTFNEWVEQSFSKKRHVCDCCYKQFELLTNRPKLGQWNHLIDKNNKLVLPKENIYDINDIEKLYVRLEELLDTKLERLHINSCNRSDAHYSTFYNDTTRKIVEKYYHKDIETFGYKFEEQANES